MLNELIASESESIEIEFSVAPPTIPDPEPEIEAEVEPEVEPKVESEPQPEIEPDETGSELSAIESGDLNADSLRYKS